MFGRSLPVLILIGALLAPCAFAQQQHSLGEHRAYPNGPRAVGGHGETRPGVATTSEHPTGPHGGNLYRAGDLQAETVIEPGALRLFVYDRDGQPIDLRAARGLATLKVQGGAKRYRYDLFPEIRKDQSAEALAVAVDLRRIAGQQAEIAVQLVGVPGAERQPVTFTASAVAPMTEQQRIAAAIAGQKVCPVSGQPLGSMGEPIPVTIGEQTVYVCCAGCIDAVNANPERYLATKPQLQVAPATEADAETIALQQRCPVMDEPLGSMGPPLKVTGLGRDVFLCCKGCLKFLEKDPAKYLAKLPPLSEEKPTVVKATEADSRFVAAQKLCPVVDEPLDAMGGPFRTVVEGRVVYLCCPGCAKKLHANPAAYLAKLRGQGVTPPAAR